MHSRILHFKSSGPMILLKYSAVFINPAVPFRWRTIGVTARGAPSPSPQVPGIRLSTPARPSPVPPGGGEGEGSRSPFPADAPARSPWAPHRPRRAAAAPAAPAPLTEPPAPGTLRRHLRLGSGGKGRLRGSILQVRTSAGASHLLQVPSRPLSCSLSHKGRPPHPSPQVCAGRLPTPALSPSDTCNHPGWLSLEG